MSEEILFEAWVAGGDIVRVLSGEARVFIARHKPTDLEASIKVTLSTKDFRVVSFSNNYLGIERIAPPPPPPPPPPSSMLAYTGLGTF